MKHLGAEYNERIQDSAGKIPADEPVFLLRGQDQFAARAVKFYADLCLQNGADPEFCKRAVNHAQAMHLWPHRKTPDAPGTDGGDGDVSRETMTAAYQNFHAMLTGVVVDFNAFLTSPEYERTFRDDLDGGEDEPLNIAYALMEGLKAWAKSRHVDDGRGSMDWRQKLVPGAWPRTLDR